MSVYFLVRGARRRCEELRQYTPYGVLFFLCPPVGSGVALMSTLSPGKAPPGADSQAHRMNQVKMP